MTFTPFGGKQPAENYSTEKKQKSACKNTQNKTKHGTYTEQKIYTRRTKRPAPTTYKKTPVRSGG